MARNGQHAFHLVGLGKAIVGLLAVAMLLILSRSCAGELILLASSLGIALLGSKRSQEMEHLEVHHRVLAKADAVIQKNIETLRDKRAELASAPESGGPGLEDRWSMEINDFIVREIVPTLTPEEIRHLQGDYTGIARLIMHRRLERAQAKPVSARSSIPHA
jgi:hypothetical protein